MRKLCISLFLLAACGDDGAPRDDDGPTDETGDDADVPEDDDFAPSDEATDVVDIDAPAGPAMGCVAAEIAADCPAVISVIVAGAGEGTVAMARQDAELPPRFFFQVTNEGQPGVKYSFNRRFAFTCATNEQGERTWAGTYNDSCYSTNGIGNYTTDFSSAQYETRASRCPEGVYAYTGGFPANADYTTCQDLREGSSFTVTP
jgi:hypothetical protein